MVTLTSALGRVFDIGIQISPVDSQTAAMTGVRVAMENFGGICFVVIKAAGTANDDPVLDLQEHTASTGGTTQDLDIITSHWEKQETTLDGDEAWVEATQTAASEVTLNATSAESEMIVVIDVRSEQLSDTYTHVSLNIADTGAAGAQLITCIAIPYDLKVQRLPSNMASMLNPGTANV